MNFTLSGWGTTLAGPNNTSVTAATETTMATVNGDRVDIVDHSPTDILNSGGWLWSHGYRIGMSDVESEQYEDEGV